MRVLPRLLLFGGLALLLGLGLLAGGAPGRAAGDKASVWQPLIPDADAKDLIKFLGQVEQDALKAGQGKMDKKEYENKIATTPLLIAVITQSTKAGPDAQDLAAYRAAALQLSDDAQGGKMDAAQAQAAALASLRANGGGSTEPAKLEDKGELLDYMSLLKLRSKGGIGFGLKPPISPTTDGIEARVMGLAKRAPSASEMPKQADDIARAGYVLAAISEITDAHTPKKSGGKDPKDWAQWNKDMRDSALQLVAAAQAKDAKAIKAAATKLNASCNDCHGTFRD